MFDFRPGGGAAGDQRAAVLERPHAFIPGGRAHVLDYDVHALFVGDLSDFLGDFLLVVIDAVISAQFAAFGQLGIVARGSDHAAMKKFGDLNGGDADPGPRPQHQHGLSGTNARATYQHVPRGYKHERHAGRLIEIERIGNRNHIGGGSGDQFAIAAIHAIAQHGEFTAKVLHAGHAFLAVPAIVHRSQQHALPRLESGDVLADFDYFSGTSLPRMCGSFTPGSPLRAQMSR